jgi:hypothetical protein
MFVVRFLSMPMFIWNFARANLDESKQEKTTLVKQHFAFYSCDSMLSELNHHESRSDTTQQFIFEHFYSS